jgi:hypothetical protein
MDNVREIWEKAEEHLRPLTQELRTLLRQPVYHFSKLRETEVPESMGVYILYDDQGTPTYVGKAGNVEKKASR